MKDIWRKWFGKKSMTKQGTSTTSNLSHEKNFQKQKKVPSVLEDLEAYLFARYDFRFNVLTEQTEYTTKGSSKYKLADQRALNTFCMEARKAGINCWDKDISRLLLSQEITDFHPFLHYVTNLPEWDGVDRVSELAKRVSEVELWVNGFHLNMGRLLVGLGVERVRTRYGSAYRVIPV